MINKKFDNFDFHKSEIVNKKLKNWIEKSKFELQNKLHPEFFVLNKLLRFFILSNKLLLTCLTKNI